MITLNGTWQMNCKGEDSWQEGQVPGTVYTDLLRNGHMGSCENMHRTYRFDVTELLKAGTNEIVVELHSPLKYMEEQYEKRPL